MLYHLLFLFNYNIALLGVISPHLLLALINEILKYSPLVSSDAAGNSSLHESPVWTHAPSTVHTHLWVFGCTRHTGFELNCLCCQLPLLFKTIKILNVIVNDFVFNWNTRGGNVHYRLIRNIYICIYKCEECCIWIRRLYYLNFTFK